MLCPNIDDTSNLLLSSFNQMQRIKSLASVCNSLQIGKPGDIDPDWLIEVRSRLNMLRDSMAEFMAGKPDIFAGLLYSFIDYQTLFAGINQNRAGLKGTASWLAALKPLSDTLNRAVQSSIAADREFSTLYQGVKDLLPLMDASIERGWVNLGEEEQAMLDISSAMGALQQAVGDMSQDLTASDVRNGKTYVQTAVTLGYEIVTSSSLAVPYLSFAALIFTVGDSLYEVISTSDEIQQKLRQIRDLQNEATAEAQALAATKAALQMLYQLEGAIQAIGSTLPRLTQMWAAERDKIVAAMDALNAGSDPALYFDIQTIRIANATWTALAQLVNSLQLPPATGQAVSLQPNA